jgi:hypothetical protein
MEYHYTYLLVSDDTPHLYIGVRTSKVSPENDLYMSSSSVVRKMRSEGITFSKYIISEHSSREEALNEEIALHRKYSVDIDPIFLNKVIQPSSKFSTFPSKPTNPILLERWIENKRKAGRIGGSKGGSGAANGKKSAHKLRRPKSQETKDKMRLNANVTVSCLKCRLTSKLPIMNSSHFPKCFTSI